MTDLNQLKNILEAKGFAYLGSGEESGYLDEELESYRNWEIALSVPNGGIIAVDIIHRDTGGWWGYYTEGTFDYHDEEGIIAFAKRVIDEVERELESVSGQLSLFEAEAM